MVGGGSSLFIFLSLALFLPQTSSRRLPGAKLLGNFGLQQSTISPKCMLTNENWGLGKRGRKA